MGSTMDKSQENLDKETWHIIKPKNYPTKTGDSSWKCHLP